MKRIDPFLALEASAGSGKTFALSIRYVSLLFLGVKPSKILALTFTNKAANEMRVRIEDILKNLQNKESELKELSHILKVDAKELLKRRDKIYSEFIKDENYIMTIDKFCTLILRKFSLFIALMPDFTVEQRDSTQVVLEKFIDGLKRESLQSDFIKFSAYEEKKLNSLLDTLEFFYEKFYELPPKKETQSFDNRALEKVFEAIKNKIISCEKLSSRGRDALKIETLDDISKKGWICKESLGQYSFFKKCYKESWDEKFRELKELLKRYILSKEAGYINTLIDFFTIYKESVFRAKKELNDLSFSDISAFTYKILSSGLDRDFFYFRLDSRFDHILIDEFQDTSILQYRILKPLFDEITSGFSKDVYRSLFYVGDVKQSIYRFRGGSKELFFEVAKSYGIKVEQLDINYRSAKEIVEFVNETFRDIIEGYFDQKPFKKESGYVEVENSSDIIGSVKKSVSRLLKSGVKSSDIAILTFTNDESFFIADELKKEFEGIAVSTGANLLIKDDMDVRIVIECMKYIYFEDRFFLLNLLSLLGKEESEELDLNGLSKDNDLFDFTKKMIDKFSLSSEILLQFMESIGRFKDLESFLFELDEYSDEVKNRETEALKVLTIHKSKGLEFKHLIICDKLKRAVGDRSSFLLYQEDLSLKDMFLKVKNRECLDKSYREAYEKEKRLDSEDKLNALYVAFTRAKESLFILQKEKSSAFGELNLKECQRGIFPTGKEDKKDLDEPKIFEYDEPKVAKQSRVVTAEDQDEYESDFEAIDFGLATHYMLEMMAEFEEEFIEDAYTAMKNRYLEILSEEATNDIKTRVTNLIKENDFKALVNSAKIYKELPLYYKDALKQVDLLVEREDDIVIVDYKTSSWRQKSHFEQVDGYIEAVKSITNKDVKGYLCYLKSDGIEVVKV